MQTESHYERLERAGRDFLKVIHVTKVTMGGTYQTATEIRVTSLVDYDYTKANDPTYIESLSTLIYNTINQQHTLITGNPKNTLDLKRLTLSSLKDMLMFR